jgi:K+-transporting ATPase c subunit
MACCGEVATEKGFTSAKETDLRALLRKHTLLRAFGLLGEPRVNVARLNLDLDRWHPKQ